MMKGKRMKEKKSNQDKDQVENIKKYCNKLETKEKIRT